MKLKVKISRERYRLGVRGSGNEREVQVRRERYR